MVPKGRDSHHQWAQARQQGAGARTKRDRVGDVMGMIARKPRRAFEGEFGERERMREGRLNLVHPASNSSARCSRAKAAQWSWETRWGVTAMRAESVRSESSSK